MKPVWKWGMKRMLIQGDRLKDVGKVVGSLYPLSHAMYLGKLPFLHSGRSLEVYSLERVKCRVPLFDTLEYSHRCILPEAETLTTDSHRLHEIFSNRHSEQKKRNMSPDRPPSTDPVNSLCLIHVLKGSIGVCYYDFSSCNSIFFYWLFKIL